MLRRIKNLTKGIKRTVDSKRGGDSLPAVLKDKLPTSISKQADAFEIIQDNISLFPENAKVIVDLGAGTGRAYGKLKKIFPEMHYTGVDIESSPEVSQREREDIDFVSYDGVNLPFEENSIDVIFSNQVLEHVRYPDPLIAEVCRILKPGGVFVGSVSCLEPYHSHSIFNWTAYGIVVVFEDNGLVVDQIRPGIDGISLIWRRLFGKDKFNVFFGEESLFNHYIDAHAKKSGHWEANFQKVMFAGHLCFLAHKPGKS